jgi:hypothetical protein
MRSHRDFEGIAGLGFLLQSGGELRKACGLMQVVLLKRALKAILDVFLKKYWQFYVIFYIEGTTLILILFS